MGIRNNKKIIDELQNEHNEIKKEFDEYKVRHHGNVDVKNGKTYMYKTETKHECTRSD